MISLGSIKLNQGIKNLLFVGFAQSISVILGIVRILLLPTLLGISYFGYWQVYFLYVAFLGIFALGFNDGIYLKYGKYDYKDLPFGLFRRNIQIFIAMQLVLSILVYIFVLFEHDINKQFALTWVVINIPVVGLTGVLIYIYQITNQMKKYSIYSVIDKVVMIVMVITMIFTDYSDFKILIILDTVVRLIILFLMVIDCKELFLGEKVAFKNAFPEYFDNIRVGINLLLANLVGMLILGYGRILLERTSSIEVFSTYSFAMSTINLVLVMITSIAVVIYPLLSRYSFEKSKGYFVLINKAIFIFIPILMGIYFPVEKLIIHKFNEYSGSIVYLPILFVIIYVQSKMQVLINNYYKLLRKERELFKANVIGFILAIVIITPLYYLTNSVFYIALGTLIAMYIRMVLSERYIAGEISNTEKLNCIKEFGVLTIFLLCCYLNLGNLKFIVLIVLYSILILMNLNFLKEIPRFIRRVD